MELVQKIEKNIFVNSELIPKDLLEQQVFDWIVIQCEGIIEVNAYHQVIMRKIQNSNKKE